VKTTSAVQENFFCGVCRKLAVSPWSSFCKHLFCAQCLQEQFSKENNPNCPVCKSSMGPFSFSLHEDEIIKKFYIKCSECNFSGYYESFDKHDCSKYS
jgi:hypothetical protein